MASWLIRRAPATLVGLALAGSLWFGLITAFVRLHLRHRLPVGNVDPRLIDLGMLALNVALLASFVAVHIHRSHQPTSNHTGVDGGTPASGAPSPVQAPR